MTNNETKGRQARKALVETLKDKFERSKSVVFADYKGLTAQGVGELRTNLRDGDAEVVISKNTLLKLAAEKEGLDLKGQTMAVFSYSDPITGIKSLFEFAGENDNKPVVMAGVIEGQLLEGKDLQVLSKLPSKHELQAKVVGSLKSPIFGLVNTLNGVQVNFVRVLSEISKVK